MLFRHKDEQLRRRGDSARDASRWTEAAEWYQAYLAARPTRGPIWVQLGNCLKEAGDLIGAKAAYRQAEALMPQDADLHVQFGHLAKLEGRVSDAIAAFEAACAYDPSREDALIELKRLSPGTALVVPPRDRALNAAEAALDTIRRDRSAEAIADFLSKVRPLRQEEPDGLTPRMLHFVFGFKEKGDLPYYACMAIRSALHFNPGWRAFYYTQHEPTGPNWDQVKEHVTVILLRDFEYFGNARLHHYAHKADIIRMLVLNEIGGLYLDVDTITQRSFEDLRQNEFVMAVQAAGPDSSSGLCNAVMMGQAKARFSTRWLAEYDYFRSKGRDDLWDYHSVKLPVRLAAAHPDEITVLDYRAFFYPLWHSIQRSLFTDAGAAYAEDFAVAWCFHLWNGATGSWLENIDLAFVRSSNSIYAQIARQVEGVAHAAPSEKIHS